MNLLQFVISNKKMDTFYGDVKKKLKEIKYREVKPSGNSSVWACVMIKTRRKYASSIICRSGCRMQMNEAELTTTSAQL